MIDLKTCPFCGGEAHISYNTIFGFVPWCENDGCMLNENTVGYKTEQEASSAWNKRAYQICDDDYEPITHFFKD